MKRRSSLTQQIMKAAKQDGFTRKDAPELVYQLAMLSNRLQFELGLPVVAGLFTTSASEIFRAEVAI